MTEVINSGRAEVDGKRKRKKNNNIAVASETESDEG